MSTNIMASFRVIIFLWPVCIGTVIGSSYLRQHILHDRTHPAAVPLPMRPCSNTCTHAYNGICQDGRDDSENLCQYGTDCNDCDGVEICSDDCTSAIDGHCDDGGPASNTNTCQFGTDCQDCGIRKGPIGMCSNGCVWPGDGYCDDGGPNAMYDICDFGTDCQDCGQRMGVPICSDACSSANDGTCQDGGVNGLVGNEVPENCGYGTDCSDCGVRAARVICNNTCSFAIDNECDDGGVGSDFKLCELGTDCYDCGPRAAISHCSYNPCKNGATCIGTINGYLCLCADGWTGTNCNIEPNACLSNPCKNNGTCVKEGALYNCICLQGWQGINCEIEVNECLSDPCENGGVCIDLVNGYFCACQPGMVGERCENDIEPPYWINCPENVTRETLPRVNFATVKWNRPHPQDNSGRITFENNHDPGEKFDIGVHWVKYVAYDSSFNTATCSFVVEVTDSEAPTIESCPKNILTNAENGRNFSQVNWTEPIVADNSESEIEVEASHLSGDYFNIGQHTITYIFTDASENVANCSFLVQVNDTEEPNFNGCPQSIMVENDIGFESADVTWVAPEASDNSGDVVEVTSNFDPGESFSLGTFEVVYTATDSYGNVAKCCFNVTVKDSQAPKYPYCPHTIQIHTDPGQDTGNATWIIPISTDNSGGNVIVESNYSPGHTFPIGNTSVLYTASDLSGNVAECQFFIDVSDIEPPFIIDCPECIDLVAENSTAVVVWDEPIASDNSKLPVNVTSTHKPGDVFVEGVSNVSYTFTDVSGNTACCHFVVTVQGKHDL
ncbi:hyalin-like [Ptychodera flava]|uniref:hyalin-like n=1 Tax=Ptychodera flava TaxID=63121 RepID=UPI00396A1DAD